MSAAPEPALQASGCLELSAATGAFRDTEEQAVLRHAVDGYFRGHASPGNPSWSQHGWLSLAKELGILAAPLSEELGGAGGNLVDATIIMELIGEHLLVEPYLACVIMGGRVIEASASPRRAELIGAIAAADVIVVPAYLEAVSTSDPYGMATDAEADGNGGFVLNGIKIMVWGAPWATHFLVFASCSSDRDGGVLLLLVKSDLPGVTLHPARSIDGFACADVSFNAVWVKAADVIAGARDGRALLEQMLIEATVALCAEGVGLMRSMLAQTVDYAQQREQFGKRLADFQVIQHRLVDMRLAFEHATSIARAAVWAVQIKLPNARLLASAAKYLVNHSLNHIGRDAVQVHGAMGMMDETKVARYFKRATVLQLQCGSASHHLDIFAAHAGATLADADTKLDVGALMAIHGDDQVAAFRDDVRSFLQRELTPELRAEAAWEVGAFATPAASKPWQAVLAAKGWVAPAWPEALGGTGWSPRMRQIFEEELAHAGAPRLPGMGLQMCGPVIIRFGSAEQKARFLPGILSGDDYWCQGYSEPNAGSDLAALQLRATRDGDDYVLNGSKIWTTFAQFASWIFVLARTAQRERRQDGISFLLVPMATPGITIRPLISLSGEHEVNQVFFENVRVPVANRVGPEHEGWEVAKYLLEFERGVGHQVTALGTELERLRHIARCERGAGGDAVWSAPAFRRSYAELEIKTLAIRLTEERLVYSNATGESPSGLVPSLMKLAWSEMAQEIAELTIDTLGPYAAIDQGAAFESKDASLVVGPDYACTPMRRYLNDRVLTIAGGSSEVQRTIIAKYMLT